MYAQHTGHETLLYSQRSRQRSFNIAVRKRRKENEMELTNTSQEFLDWLNECPVKWFLDKQDDESLTYTFMKENENEED